MDLVLAMAEQNVSYVESKKEQKTFQNSITLKVSFKYTKNSKNVLENINLSINRGERIGLIGSTGCGKTTILNIIMGLLTPSSEIFNR